MATDIDFDRVNAEFENLTHALVRAIAMLDKLSDTVAELRQALSASAAPAGRLVEDRTFGDPPGDTRFKSDEPTLYESLMGKED